MSPVTISELTTEVAPERDAPAGSAAAGTVPAWDELERVRRAQAQLERDRARTAAEGFHA